MKPLPWGVFGLLNLWMVLEVMVVALGLVGALLEPKVAFHAPHVSLWCPAHASNQVDSLYLPGPLYIFLPPPRFVRGTAMFVALAGFALSHSAPYLRLHVGPIPPELYFGEHSLSSCVSLFVSVPY